MSTDRELPKWKTIACPKCGSDAGQSCFKQRLGAPWQWVRVAPHASRRAAAALADEEKP